MSSQFSLIRLFTTLWTTACQAPLFIGFSRQEYWSGLPFLSPEDLPNPGIKPSFLMSPALAGMFFTTSATRKPMGLDLFHESRCPAANQDTSVQDGGALLLPPAPWEPSILCRESSLLTLTSARVHKYYGKLIDLGVFIFVLTYFR